MGEGSGGAVRAGAGNKLSVGIAEGVEANTVQVQTQRQSASKQSKQPMKMHGTLGYNARNADGNTEWGGW